MRKFKYTGDAPEITLRGVTFPKGKPITVDDEGLAQKVSALPYFAVVKPRTRRNDKDKP